MDVEIWNAEVEMLGSYEAGKLGGLKVQDQQTQLSKPNQPIN